MSGYALIIEPDMNLVRRFQETLGSEGLKLDVAENGHHGVEVARHHQPDVIVLDSGVLEGDEAEKLNYWSFKTYPETQHVPIIVLTDHELERAVGDLSQPSIGDYLLPKNNFVQFTLFELLRFMDVV